jgi:hypothetical protein
MSDIFISYSRKDMEIVDRFTHVLEGAGMDVWLDREDIKAGNSWRVQIVEAIDVCEAFVLMLSANSAASANVHKEVILAQDSGRPTYVVMLEIVRLPAEIRYPLAGLQFINVPLLGFEKSVQQLTNVLKPHQKKITAKGEDSHKQTELVIQGIELSAFDEEKQKQLLAFVANLANADASQLRIASMTAGSVHVFMDMPAAAAFQLKTHALNANPRFKELNIVSLRIVGDKFFILTASGALAASPKTNPITNFFSTMIGKVMIFLLALLVIVGLTTFLPSSRMTPTASDPAPAESVTPTQATHTATPPATETSTPEPTETPMPTETPSPTPVVYRILNGVVANERIACNYGPGALYLNDEALRQGLKLQVFGRDINSGWAYVHPDGYMDDINPDKDKLCWVDLRFITLLDGGIEDLEIVYPGKVKLPPSNYWDPPKNVYTARSKSNPDKLSIYWDAFILQPGDMESATAPRYLLELWLCKGDELVFTPVFAWDNNFVADDEAGCAEPSNGVIYISEKHGYPGPVVIPWTEYP